MSMDQFLAAHYGTDKIASANENQDKVAEAELFMKLASEQGIDLSKLNDNQVGELYTRWTTEASKLAGDKEEEEKKEKAKKEHEEKSAQLKIAQEKVAEADYLGRIMAHSFVRETREIAGGLNKVAEFPPGFMAGKKGDDKDDDKEKKDKDEKDKKDKEASIAAAVRAKQAAVASSSTPSIDELAVKQASEIAKAANYDPEVATRRVEAVLTLGIGGESTKVAAAPNHEAAISARALELLERAGYPVTWNS